MNQLVGQGYFSADPEEKLKISGYYFGILEDGPNRGEPAVVLQLSHCNLSCYFCDSWFDHGEWLTLDQIVSKVDECILAHFADEVPPWASLIMADDGIQVVKPRKMVFAVTGGEPFLQKSITQLLGFMAHRFTKLQLQSNGTVSQPVPSKTTVIITPKCSQKDNKPVRYLEPSDQVLSEADCLRFVLTSDPHSPYNTIPEWAHQWQQRTAKPIFITPLVVYREIPSFLSQPKHITDSSPKTDPNKVDWETTWDNYAYAQDYCLRHGFIFNPRIDSHP
jgi:7-carboxy-7-deazaguanine synthase